MLKKFVVANVIVLAWLLDSAVAQNAQPTLTMPEAAAATENAPTADAKQTAVALNYCRASFHRIRREPTQIVLGQEQEKILNNINLDGIVDREVITLYTSVLDEINQTGIAGYERGLSGQFHDTVFQRKMVWDVLSIGADVATAHYGSAIRTGVNSWWDYRMMDYQRESELLKIEKARLSAVVQKSSLFLDTFWQMAQKKRIPDRWLVRGADLDELDHAMRERDPEVRVRILKRMEPFMEAYPPYWYYLGRTQQELGQLFAALETYTRLVELGAGHFRKDDMLATALANKAAIQDFLQQQGSVESARAALVQSSDVWEANLICARLLQRHGQFIDAEDAILRNLDIDLETEHSRVCLVSLYEAAGEREKLFAMLGDPQVVAKIPAPLLLRCAARFGQASTPPQVLRAVIDSFEAQPRIQFGPDDLVITTSPAWLMHLASVRVFHKGEELAAPEVSAGNGYYQLRFAGRFDWGNPLDPALDPREFEVLLSYPDQTDIRLVLGTNADVASSLSSPARVVTSRMATGTALRIAEMEVGGGNIAQTDGLTTDPATGSSATATIDIPLPPRDVPTAEGTQ